MKDKRGIYYHPFPQNKRVRMYVRRTAAGIEFRLWNQDDQKLWKEHGWLPYEAILQAKQMYDGKDFNPDTAYDIEVAEELLASE